MPSPAGTRVAGVLAWVSATCALLSLLLGGPMWAQAAACGLAAWAGFLAWRGASRPSSPTGPLSTQLITVQEEERKRLSRELHDGVGQIITALKMELSQIRGTEQDSERLVRARARADEALETIRSVSRLLRPTLLDDLGLQSALEWHTEDFSRRTGIRCRLEYHLDPLEPLPDPVVTGIYRTVQEALNNCEKHSQATEVIVRLEMAVQAVQVSIADNGRGFSPDISGIDHMGIQGMRERAHMLGGNLRVESMKGRGTTVKLTIAPQGPIQ